MINIKISTNKISVSEPPSVLVVDDEPFIQLALGSVLKKLGFVVDKASTGKMGIYMINAKVNRSQPYDLIIMDVNMPVMNGYEATKIIRKNPMVKTPIICVSAQESAYHTTLCKECGVDEVIAKPCTENKLRQILKKYSLI